MRSVDIAVVGGGPAGASAACGLALSGREVVLIERSPGPHHKVCGEFVSPETGAHLARLGIELSTLGAVPIDGVALSSGTRSAAVALPFRARSLSRFRLDEAILQRAADCGAELWRGVAVQSVAPAPSGWLLRCSDGALLRCRILVPATGKRPLRGVKDARDGAMVGLKIHLRPSAGALRALHGRVELFLLARGYAGLELVEDGIANLALVLPARTIAHIGRGWPPLRDFLASGNPALAERLDALCALWDGPLAVVCPRSLYLCREPSSAATGVYPVGDRFAHIPPFTGDGLAIALSTAALAVEHLRLDRPPAAYLAAARELAAPAMRTARFVSRLATNGAGRAILIRAVAQRPNLLGLIARQTRMPPLAVVG